MLNFQPSVYLAFDFLTPESLGDSIRLARDIRCLPNDHEAKLQMLEVRIVKFCCDLFCSQINVEAYVIFCKIWH